MSKFKVGDRVRYTDDGVHSLLKPGVVYTVRRILDGGIEGGVNLQGFDSDGEWWYDSRFELAEPLKLEVGATVVIDGGKDEWVVDARHLHTRSALILRGKISLWADGESLTVVKAKPEPPSFYTNAKGGPIYGDIYTSYHANGESREWWYMGDSTSRRLCDGFVIKNGIGNSPPTRRTLFFRAGKPYTG